MDGRHLIDACDKQDSPVIEERLAQLDSAWDALQSKTAARQRDIEDMAIKVCLSNLVLYCFDAVVDFCFSWDSSRMLWLICCHG